MDDFSRLVPRYFMQCAALLLLVGIGLFVLVYRELLTPETDLSRLMIAAMLACPASFMAIFAYMIKVYPGRQASAFIQPGRQDSTHPWLWFLSVVNHGSALLLVCLALGPEKAAGIDADIYADVYDVYIVAFFLVLPAASLCGLTLWSSLLICGCYLVAASLLLPFVLPLSYSLELMAGYLVIGLLFRLMMHEFYHKSVANFQLNHLEATQKLLKKQVEGEVKREIARNLHDELGHLTTVINQKLNVCLQEDVCGADALRDIQDSVVRMNQQVRAISATMQGGSFDLVAALQMLMQPIVHPKVTLDCESFEARCNPLVSEALFRACQEMVTNSIKHSNATRIDIRLFSDAQSAHLTLRDNGFGKQSLIPGNGLRGIRERLQRLNGDISVGVGETGFSGAVRVPLGVQP